MLRVSLAFVIFPSARILEKARQQLQEEILQVQSQLLDEKKKREQHEALVRRLQKRVLLLTKVRVLMMSVEACPYSFLQVFLLCSLQLTLLSYSGDFA